MASNMKRHRKIGIRGMYPPKVCKLVEVKVHNGLGELRYEVISKFIFVLKHAITLDSTWIPTSTAHVIAEDKGRGG